MKHTIRKWISVLLALVMTYLQYFLYYIIAGIIAPIDDIRDCSRLYTYFGCKLFGVQSFGLHNLNQFLTPVHNNVFDNSYFAVSD